MSEIRVASRYAKSIIELAQERGELEQVYQDMLLFSKAVDNTRELELALRNPIINHDKKKAILHAIFGGKVQDMTLGLFDIITRKNREAILPDMAREFVKQYNIVKGVNKVMVTSAVPLTDETRARVEAIVLKETGGSVQIEEKVDPSLIGGIILKVGDRQLDESLRTSLRKLKSKFNDNPYIAKI
jgi:F-type H+-transporting ATPase subunit delta